MDVLLKAQGYTKGSLRDRLNALGKAEGQLFANNDAGRAEMLAYLNGLLVKVRDRLPQVFSRMPKAPYEIRRVPPEIEIGAPGGSAQADRKSVVEGTSVSVRVDPGGARILKKK